MGGSQLIGDMPTLILVLRLSLLEARHELAEVFLEHTADVPLVHHGHHAVQLDFLLAQAVGEIESRDAELVEEAAFDAVALAQQGSWI